MPVLVKIAAGWYRIWPRGCLNRSACMSQWQDNPNSHELLELLRQAAMGNQQQWGELLDEHRERLRKLVHFRMNPVLSSRLDASDVIQDTFVEASLRLNEFLANPRMPFFLWLRFLTQQKIATLHRHHLGRAKRNINREISIEAHVVDEGTSGAIALQLVSQWSGPSKVAMRTERQLELQKALEQMDPIDREILALRHFEGLSNNEAAILLQINVSAASKRYIRALERLRVIMNDFSDMHSKE